jgi:DNA repair exonuclease SbcCD nuclease subunit
MEVAGGAVIFPCPLLRRTSLDDPTAWIAQAPRAEGTIRIGVAHGSLRIREDLPVDDHLIARHAADDLHLDYLALGHWHSRRLYADREGVERTAYSGVHEPMRFQGSVDSQTGWAPYSGGRRDEFLDAGKGEVLCVSLRASGERPRIEPVDVGHYIWQEEQRQVASKDDLDHLIQDVATREGLELKLLRVRLSGVLDAENMLRLGMLRDILTNRYLLGELDTTGLHLQPTEEEVRDVAGQGVLRRVLEQLQAEATAPEPAVRQIAERAILLLYQIAKEVER